MTNRNKDKVKKPGERTTVGKSVLSPLQLLGLCVQAYARACVFGGGMFWKQGYWGSPSTSSAFVRACNAACTFSSGAECSAIQGLAFGMTSRLWPRYFLVVSALTWVMATGEPAGCKIRITDRGLDMRKTVRPWVGRGAEPPNEPLCVFA